MQFKQQIPLDYTPASEAGVIAHWHYKTLEKLFPGEELYFIRFYNCGVHYRSWDEARAKYNELHSVK
jgi:hypothetical protein